MTILTADEVRAVGGFDSAFDGLWADVLAVADRVHDTADTERAWAWQHLLLAAANFKTHAKLFPPPLSAAPRVPAQPRADALDVPIADGPLALKAEDPATWRKLSAGLTGLSVPRTTTVLAALWPDRHVIIDWRALSAAIGLAGGRCGREGLPVEPDSTDRAEMSWQNYGWYRGAVLDCAAQIHLPPVAVERALYKLGDECPGISWAAYGQRIAAAISGALRSAPASPREPVAS